METSTTNLKYIPQSTVFHLSRVVHIAMCLRRSRATASERALVRATRVVQLCGNVILFIQYSSLHVLLCLAAL